MHSLQVLRGNAYRRFSLFSAADHLSERGISTPSEQMAALALFLHRGLGGLTDFAFLSESTEAFGRRMANLLDTTLQRNGSELADYLLPLPELAARVKPSVCWDSYRDFAELLNYRCPQAYARTAERLRGEFSVEILDAAFLASQFVLTELPKAVRRFDLKRGKGVEDAWLRTVFRRYATRLLIADTVNRKQLQEFAEARPSMTPAQTLEGEFEARIEASLPAALQRLGERERRGLELYFGFRGREHTIAEIAVELSFSEYHARATLLHGLMQLADWLGVQGDLDDREARLSRLYLREGTNLTAAAQQLHLDMKEARAILGQVQAKFARALRPRTGPGRAPSREAQPGPKPRKDNAMPPVMPVDLSHVLCSLQKEPSLQLDKDTGRWLVKLNGLGLWRVAEVREHLVRNPELVEELQRRRVPLGWLAIPDLETEREDTFADAAPVEQALRAMARRAFVVARQLADQLNQVAGAKQLPSLDREWETLAERVGRVLSGVTQAIEAVLPRILRRRGEANFLIERKEGGSIQGRWEGVEGPPLDLGAVVTQRAGLLGGFVGAMATELAQLVLAALLRGEDVLPDLPVESATLTTVRLAWRSSSLSPAREDREENADPTPPEREEGQREVVLARSEPVCAVAQDSDTIRLVNDKEGYDVRIYPAGIPGHSTVEFVGTVPSRAIGLYVAGVKVEFVRPLGADRCATVRTEDIRPVTTGEADLRIRIK